MREIHTHSSYINLYKLLNPLVITILRDIHNELFSKRLITLTKTSHIFHQPSFLNQTYNVFVLKGILAKFPFQGQSSLVNKISLLYILHAVKEDVVNWNFRNIDWNLLLKSLFSCSRNDVLNIMFDIKVRITRTRWTSFLFRDLLLVVGVTTLLHPFVGPTLVLLLRALEGLLEDSTTFLFLLFNLLAILRVKFLPMGLSSKSRIIYIHDVCRLILLLTIIFLLC